MKILVIDTSNWPLGVAVIVDGVVLGEVNTYLTKNHSLRLMPAVEQLLAQLDMKPKDLDGIGVAHGPGSYTGVRIGVTTAKTLAWTLQVPLLGVSSLQVIAQNRAQFEGVIIPIIDARRGQVYRGTYQWNEDRQIAIQIEADRLQLVSELIEELQNDKRSLLFIGEGVKQHRNTLEEGLGEQAKFAREIDLSPRASQLGNLTWTLWDERVVDIHLFQPEYLQLAEAEAKWRASQSGSC
jgi:tRNA threonylcarbamoyladenosine biosynthesis protein TsaB